MFIKLGWPCSWSIRSTRPVPVHLLVRQLPDRPDGEDTFSKNNDSIYPALKVAEHRFPEDLLGHTRT